VSSIERRGPDRVRCPRVLVVDDSSTIRRILARDLEAAGYLVTQAENGRVALERCREDAPDLVLLDVDMPEMDGLSTLTEMKGDEELRGIPVLFLTAHSGGEDVAAGLALGAQDYLRKPCEPVELLARVSTALRLDQLQRQLKDLADELDALSGTDPLTGVGNRRRFEQRLPSLVASDPSTPVGFLLLDIDHFKQINDTHGHAIGDVALRILTERMRGLLDEPSEIFRWGGEEFVVVAPGLDDAGVLSLGEQIRARVAGVPFAIDDGRVLDVTVSVGCASAPPARWEQAMEAADGAMYEAKRGGRNAVRAGRLS